MNNIAVTGHTLNPTADDLGPLSIFDRGVYFDGNDYQMLTNFMMNFECSIQVWLRPDV